MSCRGGLAALAVTTLLTAAPATAWAFVGGPGCTNLPEYNRALGALQGMTSACDMSVEEARRIIAEHDRPAGYGQAAPAPPIRHRLHRMRRQHP